MKMTRVDFADDGDPSIFHVSIPLDEAAVLYRMLRGVAPRAVTDASGSVRWGNAFSDAASGLGDLFNRFYDAGIDDVAPRFQVKVGADSDG